MDDRGLIELAFGALNTADACLGDVADGCASPHRIPEARKAIEAAFIAYGANKRDRLTTLTVDREAIRREAFEEAAKVARRAMDRGGYPPDAREVETAIRTLSESPAT